MRTRGVWVGLAIAVATMARAQDTERAAPLESPPPNDAQPGAPQGNAQAGLASDAFDRACIDLLHGQTPEGEKAIQALRDACANLMSGRAGDRIDAARRRQQQLAAQEQLRLQAEGRIQPGQGAAQPQQGEDVASAFGAAAGELTGSRPRLPLGMRSNGRPVGYTLVTNPVGWFSGLGMNATVFGSFEDAPKFSWVGGARFSATDATNGTASTFGALAGVDFFIVGRHNEGLRLGPRVELAAGREKFGGGNNTFARLGMAGELGYNFIASNGITGILAAGVGGRVAGDDKNESFSSFVGGEVGPYVSVGFGYSW